MAVTANFDRKAVEITWDKSAVKGRKVKIRTSNGGDVSGRDDVQNDGRATLTFPSDFSGSTHVVVEGAGDSKDEGTIEVK